VVQGGAAVEIASGELPGIVEADLLDLVDVLTIGVIVVAVDFQTTAVGQRLMVEQATTTAGEVRRPYRR
jgi:hypothetical protein